ncbi:Uncharacterized protein TCM_007870 [Theobroma cacao]|uniref:Uncharacterized protein n=1 Tax=Theobroma cacao TaxID=3641 RepID=A0A061E2V0_THECC|nr:Uncharacterized protein TCM_007870 [Theobroma cacao]
MMCPNFFLIQEDFTFTKVMSCAPRERKMRRVGGVQVDQLQGRASSAGYLSLFVLLFPDYIREWDHFCLKNFRVQSME